MLLRVASLAQLQPDGTTSPQGPCFGQPLPAFASQRECPACVTGRFRKPPTARACQREFGQATAFQELDARSGHTLQRKAAVGRRERRPTCIPIEAAEPDQNRYLPVPETDLASQAERFIEEPLGFFAPTAAVADDRENLQAPHDLALFP